MIFLIYLNLLDVQERHGRESHILTSHTERCIKRVIDGHGNKYYVGSEHIKHDLGVSSCHTPIGRSIISVRSYSVHRTTEMLSFLNGRNASQESLLYKIEPVLGAVYDRVPFFLLIVFSNK